MRVFEEILRRRDFSETFQMPAPTWTLPQLMWIKSNEPEVLQKAKRVLFVKDYVRYLVTGVVATDYIEAQGTLFFDMKKCAGAEICSPFQGSIFLPCRNW